MRKIFTLLTLLLSLCLTSEIIASNNQVEPQGIDLGEYAFGIPSNQLNFTNQTPYTFSFWVNIKEFNHREGGTQFINIRDPKFSSNNYPACDWGYLYSNIQEAGNLWICVREIFGESSIMNEITDIKFAKDEWAHYTLVFWREEYSNVLLYKNGVMVEEYYGEYPMYWPENEFMFMIGGYAYKRSPLNAYVDKVQFYNRALTQSEVQASMKEPLLNDESLLGYWDFENGCTTDTEGYMMADKGTIKATMYNILQTEEGFSNGTEIKPFTYGEGVNPESVLQGVEESTKEKSNTKAYVSNGVLYIENTEDINSVTVYDAMGRSLIPTPSAAEKGATSAQIGLPSAIKGVIMVKVNNEVVKVIIN